MSAVAITTVEETFFHDLPVTFDRQPVRNPSAEDFGRAPLDQPTTNDFSEVNAPFQSEGLYRWFRDWGLNE